MSTTLKIDEFLDKALNLTLLDVRSPSEFAVAHIPGALSFPLFNDEERAAVGTTYKQVGRKEAVLLGLEIVGPHLSEFARQAWALAPQGELCLHCWRGGMRSASMAWLLETAGLTTYTLAGGYKSFRAFTRERFEKSWKIVLLGGYTGSAKTEILVYLRYAGEQILDLEGLASHLGSSFGSLGRLHQPSQEMFENLFAVELRNCNLGRTLWVEDESINIGAMQIPGEFWKQMLKAPLIKLEVDQTTRLNFIMKTYGNLKPEFLSESILKLKKRLGTEKTTACLEFVAGGDIKKAAEILLAYYDKCYSKSMANRKLERVTELSYSILDPKDLTPDLVLAASNFFVSSPQHASNI